jgi:hypothetical protein
VGHRLLEQRADRLNQLGLGDDRLRRDRAQADAVAPVDEALPVFLELDGKTARGPVAAGELLAQPLGPAGLVSEGEVVGGTISVPSGSRYEGAGSRLVRISARTCSTCSPRSAQTSASGRKLART